LPVYNRREISDDQAGIFGPLKNKLIEVLRGVNPLLHVSCVLVRHRRVVLAVVILAGIKPLRSVLLCCHHFLLLNGLQLHQARQRPILKVLVTLLYGFLEYPLLVLKGSIQALRELLHSLGLDMHNLDGKIGLFLKKPVF